VACLEVSRGEQDNELIIYYIYRLFIIFIYLLINYLCKLNICSYRNIWQI